MMISSNHGIRAYRGTPAFHVDFLQGALDSRLTFARASNAWYFNASGVLTQASSNVPRFDCDPSTLVPNGLLIEEQRTNLFLNSQSAVTQNITTTAQKYTVSFYGTGSIVLSGTGSQTINGSSTTTLTQYSFTATAGTLACTVSGSVQNVQVEAGAFATSRIVTSGSVVTRALETVNNNSIPWFNASAGSFEVEAIPMSAAGYSNDMGIACFNDGSGNNRISLRTGSGISALNWRTMSGGVSQYSDSFGPLVPNVLTKMGLSFATNSLIYAQDGSIVGSRSTYVVPSGVNALNIGSENNITTQIFSGWIRKFNYWNTALSSAQLQTVTT